MPEVLLALGLIAVALLALIGHSTLLTASMQKSDDSTIAATLARSHLDRIAQGVALDHPAGRRAAIWAHHQPDTPLETITERVGVTEYRIALRVTDVRHAGSGQILGSGPTGTENPRTRLKQVEALVTWWDSSQPQRSGYGELRLQAARLLKVTHDAP